MDDIFLVDTGKLEDLKSDLSTAESDISGAIEGLSGVISSMGENGWVGPDYDVYKDDFVTRKADLEAAESYVKAYKDIIDEVSTKAVALSESISDACAME